MTTANFDQPSQGNVSSNETALSITNTGTGNGLNIVSSASGTPIFAVYDDNSYFNIIDSRLTGPGGMAVWGDSDLGAGVFGSSTGSIGVLGVSTVAQGVQGVSSVADGVKGIGYSGVGVHGESQQNDGISGLAHAGRSGVWGNNDSSGAGVTGSSTSGAGVQGQSQRGIGVFAQGNIFGVQALCGVASPTTNPNPQIAVFAEGGSNIGAGVGVVATSNDNAGVIANTQIGIGVIGTARDQSGWAGLFQGLVQVEGTLWVEGTLIKPGGMFKIDHPLDPASKYLHHSFVESSEMKNIYDGVITLDSKGEAEVGFPAWFEALNRDFRYQLTPLGAPAPNLHIAQKVSNGRFAIAGGQPGLEVSWQVTGIRKDAWARANPVEVEQEKPLHEQGFYLHPELHGEPKEKSTAWAHHPDIMRRLQEE